MYIYIYTIYTSLGAHVLLGFTPTITLHIVQSFVLRLNTYTHIFRDFCIKSPSDKRAKIRLKQCLSVDRHSSYLCRSHNLVVVYVKHIFMLLVKNIKQKKNDMSQTFVLVYRKKKKNNTSIRKRNRFHHTTHCTQQSNTPRV